MPSPKFFSFDHYLSEQSERIADLSVYINELLLTYPNVSCKIRYSIPFYDYGAWICYINPLKKKDGVELVFLQGRILSEIFPFLDRKDRKMVAGIEIFEISDTLTENILMAWEEALAIQSQ